MKSSIYTPVNLHEFMVSKRGHIDGRQGLSLGAVTGILAGAAVLFGTADRAQADYCYGLAPGQCGDFCDVTDQCYTNPPTHYYTHFCHPANLPCQEMYHIGCYCS